MLRLNLVVSELDSDSIDSRFLKPIAYDHTSERVSKNIVPTVLIVRLFTIVS